MLRKFFLRRRSESDEAEATAWNARYSEIVPLARRDARREAERVREAAREKDAPRPQHVRRADPPTRWQQSPGQARRQAGAVPGCWDIGHRGFKGMQGSKEVGLRMCNRGHRGVLACAIGGTAAPSSGAPSGSGG